jgi:hypothetical protein
VLLVYLDGKFRAEVQLQIMLMCSQFLHVPTSNS